MTTPINDGGPARIEDLAMLIRRLCRALARHDANNTVRTQALDYLQRKGLGGSPLKAQSPPPFNEVKEREDFEKEFSVWELTPCVNGDYVKAEIRAAWQAWCARAKKGIQ